MSHSRPYLIKVALVIASLAGLTAIGIAPALGQCGMRGGGMRDGGGRGMDIGTGIGIGVGIGLATEAIRRQRAVDDNRELKKGKAPKKPEKKVTKKGGDDKSAKTDDKANPKTPVADKPLEKVVYKPPVFPKIDKLENCDDCAKLWDAIVWFERAIAEDMKTLAERQQKVLDTIEERKKFAAALTKATASYDVAYYTRMIEIDDESIAVNTKMNADLQKLIDEEQKILGERIAEYEKCAEAYCRKHDDVAKYSPLPPPSIPPILINTTPEQPKQPPEQPKQPPEPPLQPPEQPKLSLPPSDPNLKICGPDITGLVLEALTNMRDEYKKNPDKQSEACHSLFDKKTASAAWDISQLSPSSSPYRDMSYNPKTDQWEKPQDPAHPDQKPYSKKPWFTYVSNMCAIPRPVCGQTVEFMGTCQHAQVVNYVQWGMMLSLCGGLYPTLGKVAHKVWNSDTYGPSAPAAQQESMIQVGSEFKEALDNAHPIPDISGIKQRLKERDAALKYAEQDCELKCELTDAQRADLRKTRFGWHWTGLTDQGNRTTRDDARTDARHVDDKARGKVRNVGR